MGKPKILVFALVLILSMNSCTSKSLPAAAVPGEKMLIGYYPSWAASRGIFLRNTPYAKLTHINYAFSDISEAGECMLGDPTADAGRIYTAEESLTGRKDKSKAAFHGNFNQIVELKKQYPDMKVLISIGGWTWSGNFSNAAKDDTSRKRFAISCVDLYLEQYAGVFDGLDIDWEYPVSGGLTPGNALDKPNYTLLLQEIRSQLDELGQKDNRHYLLTIAAPVGPGNIRNFDLPGIVASVDWINLMGYDFHGTWDTTTNFNAPLFQSTKDPSDASLNVDSAVQTYLSSGIPAEKLVLGVPFYGSGWAGVPDTDHGLYQLAQGAAQGTYEPGSFEFKDLQQDYLPSWQSFWSDEAQVPWLYDPASQIFISYDDARSLEAKAGYARDQGLAGVMIWEISQGDETLIDGIYRGFEIGGPQRPTPEPKVMIPRPFEMSIHKVSGITIDGNHQDWPVSPDITLDKQEQIVYTAAPKLWDGPQDLSAKAWVGWSEEGLYFAFDVADDIHKQMTADETLWHGDHMEIQLDTQLEKDYDNPGMNNDDFQIGLSLGDFKNVPMTSYAWFNGPNNPGPVEGLQMAYSLIDGGYTLEAFIPALALPGISLSEGSVLGMNISPSDADVVGQGQQVMLSTSMIRTYADPRTFGKITLVK
ncbi:MAG: glycosyl hydrolase family 18 protein [Acidobacteriaceae bacterium]